MRGQLCTHLVVVSIQVGLRVFGSTSAVKGKKKKKKNSRARVETTADQNSLVSRKKNLSEMKAPLG